MKLSDRETEICKYLILGMGNEEIGDIIHISRHTVKAHLRHIFELTNAKNRTELAYLLGYEHFLDNPDNFRKNKREK